MNQSGREENSRNGPKRGKTCADKPGVVLVIFLQDWLRKWREFFNQLQREIKEIQNKRELPTTLK